MTRLHDQLERAEGVDTGNGGTVDTAVEARGPCPILAGRVQGILDPDEPLLEGIDEEQPSQRPVRLSAEGGFGFLVEQQDPATRRGELGPLRAPRERVRRVRNCEADPMTQGGRVFVLSVAGKAFGQATNHPEQSPPIVVVSMTVDPI